MQQRGFNVPIVGSHHSAVHAFDRVAGIEEVIVDTYFLAVLLLAELADLPVLGRVPSHGLDDIA